jgi:hypothetical protein
MGPEYRHFARSRARKRLKLRIAACAALAAAACLSAPAHAQSATAQTFASVVAPGTLVASRDLNFGAVVQPSAPGTVTVSSANAATCTTTGGLVRTGTCASARFDGQASGFSRLQFTQPSAITLTGPGGATMSVDNFSIEPGSGIIALPFLNLYFVTGNDPFSLYVGARLHVAANQTAGTYHGTFQVQMEYN